MSPRRWRRVALPTVVVAGAALLVWRRVTGLARRRPADQQAPVLARSRRRRNADIAKLGVSVGTAYASTNARKLFASSERRESLDREFELRSAEAVAERLGQMKGALMKLGQMASYLDDGLPEPMRMALAQLQSNAPPMSGELAASVIREELGDAPERIFVEWDPVPIASASIGQVHRAVWFDPELGTERAVAVKVQYPGVAEAITADLRNAELLGTILKQGFGGLDPAEMVDEIKARLVDELDYELEARNQQAFGEFFRGHPYIVVPPVVATLSTRRVLTTELSDGRPFSDLLTWGQDARNHAAEVIYRFVFRSLYSFQRFNGDPHPGNYLFHRDGRVTFLDFGLVKHFTPSEMHTFQAMVEAAVLTRDGDVFLQTVIDAGMLRADAPVDRTEAVRYFSRFYEPVRESVDMTWSSEYATSIVRHTFDRSSPIAQYATVPKAFVFIQRINLGLYAILGQLGAIGNYRRIAEELWPMTKAPPSTPIGHAEAPWLGRVNP